ncbi:MAG: 3-phosphoglycerate dehydrogenase, partial [Mogibacterium diversum]|nr:3-phosphoglycerate dehydrogenase [Mogibacterium diversum]
ILFKGELDVEAAVKAAYGSVDDVCVGKSRSEYGAAIALVPADASGELSGEGILRVREL